MCLFELGTSGDRGLIRSVSRVLWRWGLFLVDPSYDTKDNRQRTVTVCNVGNCIVFHFLV